MLTLTTQLITTINTHLLIHRIHRPVTHKPAGRTLNRLRSLRQRIQHSLQRMTARRRQRITTRTATNTHRTLRREQHTRPTRNTTILSKRHRIHTQALSHDLNSRRILIHAHELTTQLSRRRTRRTRTSEEIQHPITRAGTRRNHTAQQTRRLLRGITRLLLTRRRHNSMPPHIRRELTARSLLLSHQTGSHIGFTINLRSIEVIAAVILRVHQNIVVLRRPAARRLRTVVISPNQLINEVLTTKNHVAHNLHIMNLTPIQVQVQGAVLREQTMRLLNTRR